MANILIVDDEPDVLNILERILERAGHNVRGAKDGKAALRMFAGDPADVVITDIFMPEMDGIELLVRVREAFPKARIIALSGGGYIDREEVLQDALRLGAVEVLTKPFSAEECVKVVRRVLEAGDEGAGELVGGA